MGILLTQTGGILGPIAKIFGFIMNAIFELLSTIGIESIGFSIILFTTIIYTLMLPMQIKQQKFTIISSIMNPELQAIQKKYKGKNDQASMLKMQDETKLVYEKYGTSPTGGCLGSLIQLPLLFALWPVIQNIPAYVKGVKEAYLPLVDKIMATNGYQAIMEAIGSESPILINPEKYDYTKVNTLIDVLYKFQESTWDTLIEKFPSLTELIESTEATLMNFNYFFGINIAESPSSLFGAAVKTSSIGIIIAAIAIPVLAGFTQWLSIKLSQNRNAAKMSDRQEENTMLRQMNTMMKIMPVFSVIMCFSMPVGLGIYWITSAVVRTVQQVIIDKVFDKKPIEELIKENMEKAAKKRDKKKAVDSKNVNTMAQMYTKKLDEMKAQIYADAEKNEKAEQKNVNKKKASLESSTYKSNAKPGSLASKANMVSDYNRNNK